jgi:hypothetical protein
VSKKPLPIEGGVMACQRGQDLQDDFDKAVGVRIEAEDGGAKLAKNRPEKVAESTALYQRSFHVRECPDCWINPPKPRRTAAGAVKSPEVLTQTPTANA